MNFWNKLLRSLRSMAGRSRLPLDAGHCSTLGNSKLFHIRKTQDSKEEASSQNLEVQEESTGAGMALEMEICKLSKVLFAACVPYQHLPPSGAGIFWGFSHRRDGSEISLYKGVGNKHEQLDTKNRKPKEKREANLQFSSNTKTPQAPTYPKTSFAEQKMEFHCEGYILLPHDFHLIQIQLSLKRKQLRH